MEITQNFTDKGELGEALMESQILYRYKDSLLQIRLIDPTIQDTTVSKHNNSIKPYLYLSKKYDILKYTCNVKVLGCILDCRTYEMVLKTGISLFR